MITVMVVVDFVFVAVVGGSIWVLLFHRHLATGRLHSNLSLQTTGCCHHRSISLRSLIGCASLFFKTSSSMEEEEEEEEEEKEEEEEEEKEEEEEVVDDK
jgi:hypothetical protein